jgi:hypothetical protein
MTCSSMCPEHLITIVTEGVAKHAKNVLAPRAFTNALSVDMTSVRMI